MADKTKSIRNAQARAHKRGLDRDGRTGRVQPDDSAPGGVRTDLVVRPVDIDLDGSPIVEVLPQAFLHEVMGHQPGAELGFWGAGDARVDLLLTRDTDDLLRLRGEVTWPVAHSCVRCLEPVTYTLEMPIDLRLFPGRADLLAGESVDLDPHNLKAHTVDDDDDEYAANLTEDEDFVLYPETGVDVVSVLREQAFLELPAHPTCEDPASDSPSPCVSDTMDHARKEAERWVDPRWDALRALSDRLKN